MKAVSRKPREDTPTPPRWTGGNKNFRVCSQQDGRKIRFTDGVWVRADDEEEGY